MEGAGAVHPAVVRAGERGRDVLERRQRIVDRPVVARWSGKPIGIVVTTFVAVRMGLRAPGGLSYLHTLVLGVAAGIGFTVALFFATAAFPPGAVLDEVKMGALLSFLAAPLAIGSDESLESPVTESLPESGESAIQGFEDQGFEDS